MNNDYIEKMNKDRAAKNEYLRTESNSPIPAEEREEFSGLNYFDPDINYRFELEIIEFAEKEPIIVKDSKGNDRHFIKFGKLIFKVGDINNELIAYKADPSDPRLFIPFKDATTAKET